MEGGRAGPSGLHLQPGRADAPRPRRHAGRPQGLPIPLRGGRVRPAARASPRGSPRAAWTRRAQGLPHRALLPQARRGQRAARARSHGRCAARTRGPPAAARAAVLPARGARWRRDGAAECGLSLCARAAASAGRDGAAVQPACDAVPQAGGAPGVQRCAGPARCPARRPRRPHDRQPTLQRGGAGGLARRPLALGHRILARARCRAQLQDGGRLVPVGRRAVQIWKAERP
mmetsp:Transcript_4232/g.11164  ORF Transcript_4232/g.11164 Transcript_4232/m.11164 type:complete len:231 (+) Transcript_4232:1045-1737(+)